MSNILSSSSNTMSLSGIANMLPPIMTPTVSPPDGKIYTRLQIELDTSIMHAGVDFDSDAVHEAVRKAVEQLLKEQLIGTPVVEVRNLIPTKAELQAMARQNEFLALQQAIQAQAVRATSMSAPQIGTRQNIWKSLFGGWK